MTAGTLTVEDLTKAYLARIALANAEGPAIQAVRMVNTDRAQREARRLDNQRKHGLVARPAARHPGAARRRRSTPRSCRPRAARSRCRTPCAQEGREARRQAQGGRRDHPRQDERHRAQRHLRLEHARGLLVARRPGAAAVRHRQDAGRLVRRLGGGDGVRPRGADRSASRRRPTRRRSSRPPASPASSASSRPSASSAAPASCRSPSRRTRRARSRGRSTTRPSRSRRSPVPIPPTTPPRARRPRRTT